MTDQNREKLINKIKKMLMTTIENGASEEEAQSSMLMAQKLMVKHGLSMGDVKTEGHNVAKEVMEMPGTDKERKVWWKGTLANIIAENFRCYSFLSQYYGGTVSVKFLGLKEDVEIAIEVFKYASEVLPYHAKKYINKRKKDMEKEAGVNFKNMSMCELREMADQYGVNMSVIDHEYGHDPKIHKIRTIMAIKNVMGLNLDTTAIKNDYIIGFMNGLRDKFKEQVENNDWGLVLVKDKDVQDKYNNMKFTRGKGTSAKARGDAEARQSGYKQGKAFNGVPKGHLKG